MLQTDISYFGPLSLFPYFFQNKELCLCTQDAFSKQSFKNRMIIATAQGPLNLTIPIVGGRDQKSPIHTIKIDYETQWREKHFKAITTSYKRSPYFEYYENSLFELYCQQPIMLIDFLLLCHNWIKTQVKGEWTLVENKNNNLPKHIHPWVPNNYYKDTSLIQYQQVFSDRISFISNLCILDQLFCCGGPQTKNHGLSHPLQ